ncbi:hypothetical protein BaRGS_00027719 [Batillaria attramentaria]|uniref:SEFIR domain-containing protein n=1 Tax=Batillaria attramentaria TaxID=370345 RepID=A0ABD0K2D2_9CAEN
MARLDDFPVVHVVGLVSLLIVHNALASGGRQCTDTSGGYSFQIFTDTTEVTEFDCLLYGKATCEQFPDKLPGELSNGSSVNKPRDFAVRIFSKMDDVYHQNRICPGLEYSWKVPIDQISRSNTKGYFLRMQQVGSAAAVCRTLELKDLQLNSPKFNFKFKMFPMTSTATYLVDLFSLPPPSEEEVEAGLFQRLVVTLTGCDDLDATLKSAEWTTWIAVGNPKNGTLEIQFGFADKSLNFSFETYTVRLFKNGETNHLNETTVNHVIVNDPYRLDENRCLCNKGPKEHIVGLECWPCKRTITEVFNVTGKPATTTVTPPKTTAASTTAPPGPADTPVTESSTHSDLNPAKSTQRDTVSTSTNAGAVAGAVVGVLALTCVLIGAIFVFRRYQRKRRHIGTKSAPVLRRKRIFLLAAEDHPQHVAAVVKFAEFLRIHCQCDVTFAPLCRPDLRGKIIYCWMAQEIEQADFVVIVTSMAAFRLYQAFQKGQVYKDADLGPEGDLFTPGIQHICGMITLSADVKKVVMVHFEHTVSDYRLPIGALPSSLYLLPKHLGDFLKHVHGLGHYSSALSKVLPLQCDIAQLQEGNDWLTAIQEAKTFERRYPDWFDEKFGKASEVTKLPSAQPLLTTQESGFYSNEGGSIGSRNSAEFQRKLSSVSMGVEGLVSDFDNRERHEPVFTKDDFIEPSMVFSTYTVPPGSTFAGLEMPDEIDDRGSTTSERLRRLNQRYEMVRVEESGGFEATQVPVHEEPSIEDQMRSLNARNEHVHFAPPQVQRVFIFNHQDGVDMEGDCVSISSAQSV